MAYYYTLDSGRYFLRWSVGAAFDGCSVLPDSVDVPEPLKTCACNVRAYRYCGGVITYNPDREDVTDDGGGSGGGGGGVTFTTDETLTLSGGVLSVNTSKTVEADNTLPVTSAAVYTTVGNIEALLETI